MVTIAGIATSSDDFSILVATLGFIDGNLEGSALIETLADESQDLTVFAPTNAAFGQLAADLGFDGDTGDEDAVTGFLVSNVEVATLDAIIRYHLSAGEQTAADITASGSVITLQGGSIGATALPTLIDAEPDLINPTLTATDVDADNGIVHVIDRVLLPVDLPGNDAPVITDIVAASGMGFDDNPGDFDMLLAAVTAAGLAETLASEAAQLTVFAPSDAGFVTLAQSLGYSGDDEAGAFGQIVNALTVLNGGDPLPLLSTVLTYHVAGTPLQSAQVLDSDGITTLAMADVTVNNAAIVDGNASTVDANLIALDIQAGNGIVHVIDNVLLPVDLLAAGETLAIGTEARDVFIGGAAKDYLTSLGGNDVLQGMDGDDILFAGDGADRINGGAGDDMMIGGVTDADLSDVFYGGAGDDTMDGGFGNDILFGMDGDDSMIGGFGVDEIAGQAGNDTITGGAFSDLLFGGEGDDWINGGFGSDRINGGEGADDFYHLGIVGHGSDWIQDFVTGDGDVLIFGIETATADDFVVHSALTTDAGDNAINEAFVSYRPTGEIIWALVDGAALDAINVQIAGTDTTFDLLG